MPNDAGLRNPDSRLKTGGIGRKGFREIDAATANGFRRRGATIMAIFGMVWAMTGTVGTPLIAIRAFVIVLAVMATWGIVRFALRHEPPGAGRIRKVPPDWERRFNRVGLWQGITIVLSVVFLGLAHLGALIPAAICLVVGIHFLPLRRIFDQPQYLVTSVVLITIAVIGAATWLAFGSSLTDGVVGYGAAFTLWAVALNVTRAN